MREQRRTIGLLWKRFSALMLGLSLAACSNYYKDRPSELDDSNADPFVIGKTGTSAPRRNQDRRSTAAGGSIKVARGDTVYGLSRSYNVPVRDIISANGLRAPYTLYVGQTLKLPGRQHHIVKRGETGSGIARAYGVNLSALMRENNIRSPYILQVGQKLVLPGGAKRRVVASNSGSTPTASGGGTKIGNKKFTPPPRTSSRFSWPVRGKIISNYGVKAGMQKNEGINIQANSGTAVKAAEAGVVVFASDALESYGNLLLLKHAGGWMTAYAHNEALLVKEGDNVKRGQTIARVGSTGSVGSPQLHFEVRRGSTTYDPLRYLVSQSAATTH